MLVIGAGPSGVDIVDHLSKTAHRITLSQHKIRNNSEEAHKLLLKNVEIQNDVKQFTANGVEFADGSQQSFDAVIYATGIELSYLCF